MNTDESELALFRAERRVREIQAKLHRWADHDPQRDLWSARCPETGTAGAGGGSGKPTGGNTGRAPRADLTGFNTIQPRRLMNTWEISRSAITGSCLGVYRERTGRSRPVRAVSGTHTVEAVRDHHDPARRRPSYVSG